MAIEKMFGEDPEERQRKLLESAAGMAEKAPAPGPGGEYGLTSDYQPTKAQSPTAGIAAYNTAPMVSGTSAMTPMGGDFPGIDPNTPAPTENPYIGPANPEPVPVGAGGNIPDPGLPDPDETVSAGSYGSDPGGDIPNPGDISTMDPSTLPGGSGPGTPGGNIPTPDPSAPEHHGYPQDRYTYEQDWIDPFIKENLMQRDSVQLQSTMADIAAGQMSPVVQQQRERAVQSALAAAASTRGGPVAATQRAMTQQMAEADRSAMEAAAQQQLQAGQQVDQMAQADAQINAQIEQQRDSMLDSLIGRGVDRNVALAQVSAELDRMKEDLTYKYWAGRLGSTTEVLKQAVENSDFLEGGVESVAELGPVINMLMGAATPEGYGLPTTKIVSDYTDDPQGIFTETTTGGAPGMDEVFWNPDTQSWEMKQGAPGERESLGVQDFAGQAVEVFRVWNNEKQIYEYSFDPAFTEGQYNVGESGTSEQADEDDHWLWGI